jgi:hypothetical protein
LIFNLAYLAPTTSGIGYLLALTGIPIYFIWKRRAGQRSAIETTTLTSDK